ncbi:hypothetical protein DNI29_06670 [Hymenobacter sediminis]|uniref:hypothetical protein n=1 Tax=Hymenobacter sediminis TaxID=2218621 RepID=UPI000DA68104|nr:hypothetical protein [Hymenobacter sediminis]RPD48306.1 hypothetical protein DNI29_06670 [Hymenobacter sediminis]
MKKPRLTSELLPIVVVLVERIEDVLTELEETLQEDIEKLTPAKRVEAFFAAAGIRAAEAQPQGTHWGRRWPN